MKGADQCPKCASRKWIDAPFPREKVERFYAETCRVCANCKTVWEPFKTSELLDEDQRYSSFKKPCGNCAFRKGSPEQSDPEKWREMMKSLGWFRGQFYCHKGVPLAPGTENGFAYPEKKDGTPDARKLRLCRGFLNALPEFEENPRHELSNTLAAKFGYK